MGSRVVDGVAREMADDFFGRFALLVAPAAAAQSADAAAPLAAPEPLSANTVPAAQTAKSPLRPALVAAALIVVAVVVWLLLR
jgi:uncharacterized protein